MKSLAYSSGKRNTVKKFTLFLWRFHAWVYWNKPTIDTFTGEKANKFIEVHMCTGTTQKMKLKEGQMVKAYVPSLEGRRKGPASTFEGGVNDLVGGRMGLKNSGLGKSSSELWAGVWFSVSSSVVKRLFSLLTDISVTSLRALMFLFGRSERKNPSLFYCPPPGIFIWSPKQYIWGYTFWTPATLCPKRKVFPCVRRSLRGDRSRKVHITLLFHYCFGPKFAQYFGFLKQSFL